MATTSNDRQKARIKRHREAGFKQTVLFIAPGDSTELQRIAYKRAARPENGKLVKP